MLKTKPKRLRLSRPNHRRLPRKFLISLLRRAPRHDLKPHRRPNQFSSLFRSRMTPAMMTNKILIFRTQKRAR